ncbi:UNVERIFIED_CONTAM: hypothetical protein FKN15_009883 [Acipenser sinensis]
MTTALPINILPPEETAPLPLILCPVFFFFQHDTLVNSVFHTRVVSLALLFYLGPS